MRFTNFITKIAAVVLLVAATCCSGTGSPGKFEIGKKTFLLNGDPFIVKAAEIHYPRIPADYWEHRIEMCKAMGMNTICLYVFWNIHEQNPGCFDFTGNNDILRFCKLAQKHGMWVIVRPGPYVCAEWEMGGLPWWLLKKKDIKVRSNDPYFLERTELFMNEVGKQLAGQQISEGGNIIMVQVENEFGMWANDKEYVANIRDIVKGAGFTGVPLFQCDWSHNFQNNGLDDLLWTINFGAGANISEQFASLEAVRPDTPLMCSEFWSGWFDHWGRKHETRTPESLVGGLREMLDRDISFSLYMAHGGTTWGHWGGANAPTYSAMCSSYDYDAPINEAGQATDKFFAVRDLLGGYLREAEKLHEVPAMKPVIEIPEFTLTEAAPIFENLHSPFVSEDIKTMEELDQGWGIVIYRTKMTSDNDAPAIMEINEVHDWATVWLNGQYIGVMDRRKNDKTIIVPPFKKGDVLDILVEAMGRVNFGYAVHDRKGITKSVALRGTDGLTELKGWEIFSFPTDHKFVRAKNYAAPSGVSTPAYYRGTFNLKATGDTFLDMRQWGKGMVWVNGHAMGRFWKIGPQQTLFMPGCWLRKGKNEIIVLDLETPVAPVISGLTHPILDMLRTDESLLHRSEGQNLDLTEETPVYCGAFAQGNGWQEVNFRTTVDARYFCLESLSSYSNDGFASVAELEVLGADGKPFPRMDWKIVYADSEEINAANNAADKIFDMQESTFWHTEYKLANPGHPHQIVIDMGTKIPVSGFRYLPRAEKGARGMIKDYRIYTSVGGLDF